MLDGLFALPGPRGESKLNTRGNSYRMSKSLFFPSRFAVNERSTELPPSSKSLTGEGCGFLVGPSLESICQEIELGNGPTEDERCTEDRQSCQSPPAVIDRKFLGEPQTKDLFLSFDGQNGGAADRHSHRRVEDHSDFHILVGCQPTDLRTPH